jgi:hypothetical protein
MPFTYTPRRLTREWRKKSDWSKEIPEYYLIIYPHKMEENHSFLSAAGRREFRVSLYSPLSRPCTWQYNPE